MNPNTTTKNTNSFLSDSEIVDFRKWQSKKLHTGSKYEVIQDGKFTNS